MVQALAQSQASRDPHSTTYQSGFTAALNALVVSDVTILCDLSAVH
jgi:hypothetical protein